jgi:hypothetical protein
MLVVVAVMFNTDPAVAVLVALVVVATGLLLKAAGRKPMEQTASQIQVVAVVAQFIVLRLLQHNQQDERVEAVAEWLLSDIKTQVQHLLLTCLLEQATAIGNVLQVLTL